MSEHRINGIRPDGRDPDRRIDALSIAGVGLVLTDNVIAFMRQGHRFYVQVGIYKVYLMLKRHPRSGVWFVQTEPDGRYDNNLLSLPKV